MTSEQSQPGGSAQPVPSILSGTMLFRESLWARARRWVLGILYALRPRRLRLLPGVLVGTLCFLIFGEDARAKGGKPQVLSGPGGFAGVSNDLTVEALVTAYRNGLFPLCHIGPTKWWCPETRAVLVPSESHVSKKVRQLLRSGRFVVTFDEEFAGVIRACAEPRSGKTPLTWITPRVMEAYYDLHRAGYAHSVEVWNDKGELVGGLYGVALGEVFFGESQFAKADHASKIAVTVLHEHLARWGFALRDAKFMSGHLATLGFREMARAEFLEKLRVHAHKPDRRGKWHVEALAASIEQPKPRESLSSRKGPQERVSAAA